MSQNLRNESKTVALQYGFLGNIAYHANCFWKTIFDDTEHFLSNR